MCKHCWNEFHKDSSEYKDNKELDLIESSKHYTNTKNKVIEELHKQRDDLILSGIVWTIFNSLSKNVIEWIKTWTMTREDEKKLFDYITGQASKKLNPLSDEEFRLVLADFLLKVAWVWWQSILDQLGSRKDFIVWLWTDKIIKQRIKTLVKWLNDTTSRKMWKNILIWLWLGYWMKELNNSLEKIGKDLASDRADLIMVTEANALLQYIRYQVAKANGATTKTRQVSEDEKTCNICLNLAWMTIWIEEDFDWVSEPPKHVNCRCWLEYDFANNPENVIDWF